MSKMGLGSIVVMLVSVVAAGCGPSSNARADGGGGTGGTTSSGGSITWKENGQAHTAAFASGSRASSSASDFVQFVGSESTVAVSFGVATAEPPLTTGTVACGVSSATAPFASFSYTGNNSGLASTCSITLTTLGDVTGSHATGTFSGSIALDSGGTAVITDGVFDVVLTVSNL
jgi:hypothetical protein